jgi:beta-glucosidase
MRYIMSNALKAAIAGLVLVGAGTMAAAPAEAQTASDTTLNPEVEVDALIAKMTLEQKVEQISNDTRPAEVSVNRPPGCDFTEVGRHIQGIPQLGIPTVRMINGGTGVRGGDCENEPVATALPSTLAAAATFDAGLNYQLGVVLGNETRDVGHQVMLAPATDLLRNPYFGRTYESYGEDPYLSGVMGNQAVLGIQSQGVQAVAKHFTAYQQDTQRYAVGEVIPPRALEELYLLPFEMSVKDAKPAAVMCAFPEINGVSACSNDDLLAKTLRESWGFEGWVLSDRRAIHDTAPSIKAGLDWELSHIVPDFYSIDNIKAALADGSITVDDIDEMLRPRYLQMLRFNQFSTDFDALYGTTPDFKAHGQVAREIAEEGIVLLKNQNNFLPLKPTAIRSIALIGATWYAGEAKLPPRSIRGDNVNVVAPYTVTPQQGLEGVLRDLGSAASVTYESGAGGSSGRDAAVELAKKSGVVIVMLGDNPHELCDRETLGFPVIPPADPKFCAWSKLKPGQYDLPSPKQGNGTDQEKLMDALIAAPGVAQKMVVVLKTEGMVLMPWLDKVPTLLEAWYPGEEDGNAVADILLGVRNPSGKLPMTFGNTAREASYATNAQFPGLWESPPEWLNQKTDRLSAQFSEGLQVGYRWYEAHHVPPVFPFGFGLSYTTFAYSDLAVTPTVNPQTNGTVLDVKYTITNTGTRVGGEVSQVYLNLPPAANEPSKRLVGFQRVDLMPGASQQVTVVIDSSASNQPLSYWLPDSDAAAPGWADGTWITASGNYTVQVGTSSADTPLVQSVSLSFGAPPESFPTAPAE